MDHQLPKAADEARANSGGCDPEMVLNGVEWSSTLAISDPSDELAYGSTTISYRRAPGKLIRTPFDYIVLAMMVDELSSLDHRLDAN
ncbi:MAG: hypothetical protein J5I62_08810 [Flavobacteriales bacterium]|nr:hypothetical protein [Flavobacteriales bacterium]MEB2340719.1 hypothetical protein [Flavobacteriia bacterium]